MLYVYCLSRLMSELVILIVNTRLYNFFVLLQHHREGAKEHKMYWNIWTPSSFAFLCEFVEII